jgi:hypothetical protein
MQPLKIFAFVIIGLPISAFLLTLFLTDGAPLQPLAPGEESGPAVATRILPLATLEGPNLERGGSVAAAGHRPAYVDIAENRGDEDEFSPEGDAEPARVINPDRDAHLFMTLFGAPLPD